MSKPTANDEEDQTPEEIEEERIRRQKLIELCECDEVLSDNELEPFAKIDEFVYKSKDNVSSSDEFDEDIDAEFHKLSFELDIPKQTYSLTKIETNLPPCVKFGVRSGLCHIKSSKFSPLSRGYQGGAVAVAAIATTALLKAQCWNEMVIDRILEDGDTYYCESYKHIDIDDRRQLTVLDLKREMNIQKNTYNVVFTIEDAAFAGTFRSDNPKKMHLAKALEQFFQQYSAGILSSKHLNIALWRGCKFFNIFDGQARKENCEIAAPGECGSAKLILVQDLTGVLFMILERSNVENDPFVLYGVNIRGIRKLPSPPDDLAEPEKTFGKPKRRPSGYKIQERFRAIVQGSFHLEHPIIPKEFHGRGHLVVAIAALIYSQMINANKWTKAMINLIFNQAHIYLVDLVKVAEKKLDDSFQMEINDLFGDIVLGVYTTKVKVTEDVIPGLGKKGTLDVGLRDFFKEYSRGILEIKKTFYGIWREKSKYYFFDPFACDNEGYRVDANDPDCVDAYKTAVSCVMMNSSLDPMINMILENTGNKEKDPFVIHGFEVLYIKTGNIKDGGSEKIIYRAVGSNRRPPPPLPPLPPPIDECKHVVKPFPRLRGELVSFKDVEIQYPELMPNVGDFMATMDDYDSEEIRDRCRRRNVNNNGDSDAESEFIENDGYVIVHPRCLILQGRKNCSDEEFPDNTQGKQGLTMALAAIAYGKLKNPATWEPADIDQIVDDGHIAYDETVNGGGKSSEGEEGEDEEETEEAEEDEEEENEEGNKSSKKVSSVLDLTMIPEKFKVAGNELQLNWKMNVAKGEANPIANLGECLERYFNRFDELILENKELMYGIWKTDGKYYLFNPYGNDDDGWRYRECPASLIVTDSINELVNIFHGILEYNYPQFVFHFICLVSIQPKDQYIATKNIVFSEDAEVEKYQIKFLPVKDEDMFEPIVEAEPEEPPETEAKENEEEEEEEEEGEGDEEGEGVKEEKETSENEGKEVEEPPPPRDPLDEEAEQDQPDAPPRLNLTLITGIIKVDQSDENALKGFEEEMNYERLKYNHPPPYVEPPKKALCTLLDAKRATNSTHSLVSRFSIDSRLAIKNMSGLPDAPPQESHDMTITSTSEGVKTKLIKLPSKKYLFSNVLNGLTPIRAINELYIHDEELDRKKEEACRHKDFGTDKVRAKEPDVPIGIRITPSIIPLGVTIKTPTPKIKVSTCTEKKKTKRITPQEGIEEEKLTKLLFNAVFPDFIEDGEATDSDKESGELDDEGKKEADDDKKSVVREKDPDLKEGLEPCEPEIQGFKTTDMKSVGIVNGNMCLENRDDIEECHVKPCYFASMLCILAKIKINVNDFRGSTLDHCILEAGKISERTGKLRHKIMRYFHNVEIHGAQYDLIIKQAMYGDPENCDADVFENAIETFFQTHSTGILIFPNASYATWTMNNKFYFFDPYACDDNGRPNEGGFACLMEFCDLETLTERIKETVKEHVDKPYRIHVVAIAHMELIPKPRKKPKKKKCVEDPPEEEPVESEEEQPDIEPESEESLMELAEWVDEKDKDMEYDIKVVGFQPIKGFEASMMEVSVLNNPITRPELAPLKEDESDKPVRQKVYNRKFRKHNIICEALDFCILAWSFIHEPVVWGVRTIRGLYKASHDYALDSILAFEDTSVFSMTDGLLSEFDIANYNFRVVFAPLHTGSLYAETGWNLAMTLKKIFENKIYTGAILVCGDSHVGVMKKGNKYYAWWIMPRTKNMRIIVTEVMEDYLKLIIKEMKVKYEKDFVVRIVTISYAKKLDPDCMDTGGLHEKILPSSSLQEIHLKDGPLYNVYDIFRHTETTCKPVLIFGSVALQDRDLLTEPRVKRCYFVALLSVMVQRDIIQSPMPAMIDKIIEVSDFLYKEFTEPKFHIEHIIRNVSIMNRIFDFRDSASTLVTIKKDLFTGQTDFLALLRKHLKKHFKRYTNGIIHFTNCCYGFWYSHVTHCYYYLDPYGCNARGTRVSLGGKACLFVFATLSDMVKQMCVNRYEHTTGFFIHQMHVESINESPFEKFQEDPMWVYLDYHWSYNNSLGLGGSKKKIKNKKNVKPGWKNYVIEIPNLIYSVWGTLGSYDGRFGDRAGKNQAAICIAIMAMQHLCHPSQWCPAILDSAVICGDIFHTESVKTAIRRGQRHNNVFNVLTCYKIFPHIWNIEFFLSQCGILYGGNNQDPLMTSLEKVLLESPCVLIECKKKVLGVLRTDDAYYAIDPSWTGPPLFLPNHGAMYVLRCKNRSSLIYVITKMLNTNQKVNYRVTPLALYFHQEACKFSDIPPKTIHKKILSQPVCTKPGSTDAPNTLINGAIVAPNADSYLVYRKNLVTGTKIGHILENPPLPSPEPKLESSKLDNIRLSTKWRLNAGQIMPKKRSHPTRDSAKIKHSSQECLGMKIGYGKFDPETYSVLPMLEQCDDYPRWVNFVEKYGVETKKTLVQTLLGLDKSPKPPKLECLKGSFISRNCRQAFKDTTKDMARDEYKTYEHKVKMEPDSEPESDMGDLLYLDSDGGDEEEDMNMDSEPPMDEPAEDE